MKKVTYQPISPAEGRRDPMGSGAANTHQPGRASRRRVWR